jgi:hypothetical protein
MENIIKINPGDFVEKFKTIVAKSEATEVPTQMLWGPPGIGKSAGIHQVAKDVEEETGKQVNVQDVRLLLFNPVDLRGIPTADAEKKVARWLKPEIFQMDPSEDVINILFLDEITAAPKSVQAAAYQMTLDRVVGEHKIPDNCFIFAAGNRVTDKSVAYKMPKALANRMTHYEVGCSIDDWKEWAIPSGINSKIIGYLNYKNSALFDFNPNADDVAYPTPRSWEMVSKYLDMFNGDLELAFDQIAGSIGLGAATEFKGYTKVYHKLPSVKDIYQGKQPETPNEPDVLYALSSAIVAKITDASKEELANILDYTHNMPAEFATLTVKDMVTIEEVRQKVLDLEEWIDWSKKYKGFIM